jgi:transposase-like protein
MHCPQCGGTELIKRGRKGGCQRFRCRACGRYSTDRAPKFSAETKAMAIEMYMNSMGIRAIGRVLKASPAAVLNWIRKEHAAVQQQLARKCAVEAPAPDIIEMDEIYTYVQKNSAGR